METQETQAILDAGIPQLFRMRSIAQREKRHPKVEVTAAKQRLKIKQTEALLSVEYMCESTNMCVWEQVYVYSQWAAGTESYDAYISLISNPGYESIATELSQVAFIQGLGIFNSKE